MDLILHTFIDLFSSFFHHIEHAFYYLLDSLGISVNDSVIQFGLIILLLAFIFVAIILFFRLLGVIFRFIFMR